MSAASKTLPIGMKVALIWLDREHARLFELSETGELEIKKFQAHHTEHHTHARDAFDHQRGENHFFKEIASAMDGAEKLAIIGPGMAKYHFRSYLMEQKPMIARTIDKVESADHPSEAQVAAMARDYLESFRR